MKKLMLNAVEVIIGFVVMICGYGLAILIFVPILFLLCLAPIYLLVETIFSPNYAIFLLDGVLASGFVLAIKNKKINSSIKEVWSQMKAHL